MAAPHPLRRTAADFQIADFIEISATPALSKTLLSTTTKRWIAS
jgi:hypothetical protein